MKRRDLPWIRQVILQSGIGTKTQRKAIAQRIEDAFIEGTTFQREPTSPASNEPALVDMSGIVGSHEDKI